MRRSAVPLSYRVILVGMIGGAHLISVGHSVFTAFLLLDVVNSKTSRLTDALFRRTKGVSFWNSAYSDGENVRQMDDETWC